MTYSAEPGHIESFRDATTNHEKMRGSMYVTFRCRDCGRFKSSSGRKPIGAKADGYRCAECHTKKTEKSAAASADKQTAASSVR